MNLDNASNGRFNLMCVLFGGSLKPESQDLVHPRPITIKHPGYLVLSKGSNCPSLLAYVTIHGAR